MKHSKATARLLAKLPATAATLTMPERRQLRELERAGVIRYVDQSGVWVDTDTDRAFARHRAADPHCTCSSCIDAMETGR